MSRVSSGLHASTFFFFFSQFSLHHERQIKIGLASSSGYSILGRTEFIVEVEVEVESGGSRRG